MLVLSRKKGDVVWIAPGTPQEVRLIVIGWSDGLLRLGFDCDRSVEIQRGELMPKVNRDRRAAESDPARPSTFVIPQD